MKSFALVFFVAFCGIASLAQIPYSGLIAYFPFTGNANDASGYGNNCSVHGATLTTDRVGNPQRAYYFDGVNDYIQVNNSAVFGLTQSNVLSFSFWTKSEAGKGLPYLAKFQNGNPANSNYYIGSTDISNNITACGNGTDAMTFQMTGAGWHHIAVIFKSGPNNTKIYVDGTLLISDTLNYALNVSTTPLAIGRLGLNPVYSSGYFDDLRIYNRVLTENEILALSAENPCILLIPYCAGVNHCGPGIVSLTASGGTDYRWYDEAAGGQPIGTNATFITPYLTQNDTFYVSNTIGCDSYRRAVIVKIYPYLLPVDTTILKGHSITLNLSGNTSPTYMYHWSTGAITSSIIAWPADNTIYKVSVTSASVSCVDSVAVNLSGATIAGSLKYDNVQNTPLCYSKVYLKSIAGLILDSTITEYDGSFYFYGLIPGNYKIGARIYSPWGGVNSNDGLLILKHYTLIQPLAELRKKAADVNNSNYVNATDATISQRRFTQTINSFVAGDWVTNEPECQLATLISVATLTVKILCTGDVNGSYLPASSSCIAVCGDSLTDGRDGQKYPTVQIGTQCWLAKNMNIGVMVNKLQNSQTNNNIIEKYCINNDPANCTVYGGLYTWDEMMKYTTAPGSQGICPAGWHIPTLGEFCTLTTFLDPGVDCNSSYITGTTAGGKLKEPGLEHWAGPNIGATNSSGFTALGGYACSGNCWGYLPASFAMFWSSTEYGYPSLAQAYNLDLSTNSTGIMLTNNYKSNAFSVRCIKN